MDRVGIFALLIIGRDAFPPPDDLVIGIDRHLPSLGRNRRFSLRRAGRFADADGDISKTDVS